ncbi:aminotransferase class I/II-fold pyridoxal phosphate-dependent enzyme [Bacillus lacus]|uniref:Aminotransferase class I/II-fold pyridoxal phosphate-dependent enzyme n=1 Tax=Metabacillus lacus TaxID=1983721 RepID=A0A7X2M0P0_9BACI|nr:GntG family PLP-dependent aldolase [Metabacillus lacus]MRX73084.1 aminotransferase class I/II-fold pyridoxal phosphate-dependent enzyme [Metabacillus lacus]
MIDLRSDTVTKPTEEMRMAAYKAEVGDDVYGEDPSVNELEATAAEILGKEEALFVTSGTQGNQIAVLTHCRPGNEIILESESHIFYYESGAVSALAGVQTRTLPGNRGAMSAEDVLHSIRPEDQHYPETGLICIENTHNRAGGAVIPLENMKQIYEIAKSHHVPVHTDGARLFNAAEGSGLPITHFTQYTDTVQICLSKGLGAPAGSILAGNSETISAARKWRKRLGGGLRQAGIIAAPGLVALTRMRNRLAEDHIHAKQLAEGIREMKGLRVVNEIDTNIVVVDVSETSLTPAEFVDKLKTEGVLAVGFGRNAVRFTTHYDVASNDIERALRKIQAAVK